MGQAKDQVVFLDTPVSSRTWTIVRLAWREGGSARSDLPPFHITGTLHKIPQGLVTEVERSHGSKEGRKMKGNLTTATRLNPSM